MVLAMVVGAVMALGRLASNPLLRWLARGYIELFRAVPLILLIFFCFLGLPKYGLRLSPFVALVLALVVYNGAILGEIFRAGILSLDSGQGEAAAALGLSRRQSMLYVIIPQAVRRMMPVIVSQLVTLLKDTSLGAIIAFDELLRRAQVTGTFFANTLQAVAVVAALYIAVNLALSGGARRLEARQRRRLGAARLHVASIEDLALTGVPSQVDV